MYELLGNPVDLLSRLAATYWPWLAGAVVVVVAGYYALGALIRLGGRWREAGGIRQPLTLMPRHLFRAKEALLANRVLREAYEPSAQHTIDLAEGQKPGRTPARFHPYHRAVLATIKDNRSALRGGKKKLDAFRQIRELADWITVSAVPDFVVESDDSQEVFWIELGKTGNETDEQLAARKGIIKNALKIKSVEPYPTKNDSVVSFIARAKEAEDPFVAIKAGAEFYEQNPAKTMTGVPLALNIKREPWKLGIHHTLIFGTSGSGKGSPIQGIIRQEAPYVAKGLVKLYGIDPKYAELEPYADPSNKCPMFERISMGRTEDDLREHAKTIAQVIAVLDHRMKNKKINLDKTKGKINLGRSFTASKSNPMVLFIIDEYFALRTNLLTTLKQESKKPLADLDTLLAMGRSYGILVIIATQFADKENIGPIRDNLGNKIVLRHEATDYITTLLLGDDALELGHNPRAIGPSNPDNGNRTAGIGFVRDENGIVQKVRFAYLSDDEVGDFAFNFRMEEDERGEAEAQPPARVAPSTPTSAGNRFSSIQQSGGGSSEW